VNPKRAMLEFFVKRLKGKVESLENVAKRVHDDAENEVFYEGFNLLDDIKLHAELTYKLLEDWIQTTI
jgi:hypothetical protein